MKAGCPSHRKEKRIASFISPRRWQLKKRKPSKRLCEKAKDGSMDRRVLPRSSESRGPRWNRKSGHSRLTRIASKLRRETEDVQSKFVRTKTTRATDRQLRT